MKIALLLVCLMSSQALALVNGVRANAPLIGELNREDGGICTVTMVADNFALTAAHCLRPRLKMAVRFGEKSYEVWKQIPHPQYKKENWTTAMVTVDLALLKLSGMKGAMPLASHVPKAGDVLTIFGYGIDGNGKEVNALQSLKLTVTGKPGGLQIRLSGKGGACKGDSGGPSFTAQGEIAGVTSWTTGNNKLQCGELTGLTPIAPHRDWILKVITK